jgi:hypothetical protein
MLRSTISPKNFQEHAAMQRNFLSYNFCLFSLILLALWQNGSCKSAGTNIMLNEQDKVATGSWGGQNISMQVSDAGARIQFACARGSISQPIALDSKGGFSVKGVFVSEPPGPTRDDIPNRPALYSGSVQDNTMTLSITLTDTDQKLGTFNLEHGKSIPLRRCR